MQKKNILIICTLIVAIPVALFYWLAPTLMPAPEAVLPANPAEIDPAVRELISQKISALQQQPRHADSHADLALAYAANQLWEEAKGAFQNAVQLDGKHRDWQYHLAVAYRQTGAHERALQLLAKLAKAHPDATHILDRYGNALLEVGQIDEAETIFRQLAANAPQSAQGFTGLGDALLQKKQYAEAAEQLEKAVTIAPKYRMAQYLLGTAYHHLGQKSQSEMVLRLGVGAEREYLPSPQSSKLNRYAVNLTTRLSQANALMAQGQPKQAAVLLEPALNHHSENVTLLNTLAVAYMRMNLPREAFNLLQKAQHKNDGKFMTFINMSSLSLRTDQADLALEFADSAIARAPRLDQPYFSRAQALDKLQRHQESLQAVLQAQARDENNPQNYSFAGDLYLKLEKPRHALAEYEKALEVDAAMLPAMVGIARTKWQMQQFDEAREALAKAKVFSPQHPYILRLEQEFNANE